MMSNNYLFFRSPISGLSKRKKSTSRGFRYQFLILLCVLSIFLVVEYLTTVRTDEMLKWMPITLKQQQDQRQQEPKHSTSVVHHAYLMSDDENFVAIDRYIIPYKNSSNEEIKQMVAVIGEGLVPLTIETDASGHETYKANFTCSMGDERDTPATVILMKSEWSYRDWYYTRNENEWHWPFSDNYHFRTLVILCEHINFDESLPQQPPLILKSYDENFHISIGSTFVRQVGEDEKIENDKKQLVYCLNPVYGGLKDPRWIIEYLEYSKAVGVSHVHFYNVDSNSHDMQMVLQKYQEDGFVTHHDWWNKVPRGELFCQNGWAAQTDCVFRSRGIYDYALFSDIDEVILGGAETSLYPEGHLVPAMETCKLAKTQHGKIGCSFNSNSVTSVFTKLTDAEEATMKGKLLMERYTHIEASPFHEANAWCFDSECKEMTRKYHAGRQKYMFNVEDLSIPPMPLWTHSISRDYNEMDKIMEVFSEDVMQIRHYQGHWYIQQNNINEINETEATLPNHAMATIHQSIENSTLLKELYSKWEMRAEHKSATQGVEWIKPVERPLKYHPKV